MGEGHRVQNGVYLCQFGPCYETVAEMKLAMAAGCDVLGMSTAYEGTYFKIKFINYFY